MLQHKLALALALALALTLTLTVTRPTRPLTAEEEELIAGAPTLRARLKESKAAEKAHFQAQRWH